MTQMLHDFFLKILIPRKKQQQIKTKKPQANKDQTQQTNKTPNQNNTTKQKRATLKELKSQGEAELRNIRNIREKENSTLSYSQKYIPVI